MRYIMRLMIRWITRYILCCCIQEDDENENIIMTEIQDNNTQVNNTEDMQIKYDELMNKYDELYNKYKIMRDAITISYTNKNIKRAYSDSELYRLQ